MGRKILCTGGSGYIGSHMILKLEAEGHEVFNYDLQEGYDITDYALLRGVFERENFDMVFHFAAQAYLNRGEEDPYFDLRVNCFGVINLLRCLEEFDIPCNSISTGAVYGNIEAPHREDMRCEPICNYGISKLTGTKYILKWVKTKGVNARITRYSSVYGGPPPEPYGRRAGPVNIFVRQAMEGGPITVYGDGFQTRDMTHIDDAIYGTRLVLERGRRGEIYNIGYGEPRSVAEVANIVNSYFPSVKTIYDRSKRSIFDLDISWFDISKAKKKLEYQPRIDLETGIGLLLFELGMR